MGRSRKTGKHLPRGMLMKHGAFYLKATVAGKQKWTRLSDEYGEALRKYADLVGATAKPAETIGAAIAHFLGVRAKDLKPDTIAGYEQSARRLIPIFGAMPVADLRRDQVYRYLIERGNVAANRDRALLSAVFTHLINVGLHRGVNPCVGLRYRNAETARQRYVSDAEFAKLVTELPRTLALMARWSYLTGMRESDMLALRLTDGSGEGVAYTPGKARKGKEKAVLMEWTDELREVWRQAAGLRIGAQPLFATRNGDHYSRTSFQSTWQRWKKRIGIADLRWHDIRRKTGSDSVTDQAATELLGHADGATTKRHYRAKPRSATPIR